MRKLLLSIAGVTALAASSGANAALTITTAPGVDPYAGPAPTYTFDPGSRPGGATTSNFFTGTNGLINAQPFGTAAGTGAYGGLGYYFAVGPGTSTPGLIDLTSFGDIGSISFIWGSVDQYNTLDILDGSMNVLYTIVGNDIFNPAKGVQSDPNQNPLVTLTFTMSDIQNVSFLKLSSSQNAFEIDNLRVSGVPEPATWAMMLLGFGGIGLAMRRRRRPALTQVA